MTNEEKQKLWEQFFLAALTGSAKVEATTGAPASWVVQDAVSIAGEAVRVVEEKREKND